MKKIQVTQEDLRMHQDRSSGGGRKAAVQVVVISEGGDRKRRGCVGCQTQTNLTRTKEGSVGDHRAGSSPALGTNLIKGLSIIA